MSRADALGGFALPAPNLSRPWPGGEQSGGGSPVPARVGVRRQARQVVHGGQARLSLAPTQLGERFPPRLLLLSSSSIPVLLSSGFWKQTRSWFGAASACVAGARTKNPGLTGDLEAWDLCRI